MTDAVQGKANVLSVPPRGTAEPPQSSSEERLQNNNRRPAHVDSPSSAQTRDAAATAAEVADTARSLDNVRHPYPPSCRSPPLLTILQYGLDDSRNDGARADYARKDHDPRTCLFSHEDLGAYDFEDDDGSGNDSHDAPEPLSRSKTASSYETDDIDVNDPTIESFPCDRTSVMNTLRTIQSSLGEDHVQRADQGASSSSRPTGRRSNNDSAVDSNESAASPTYPTHSRPRDSRSSSGSILGKDKSAAPLGSIAE